MLAIIIGIAGLVLSLPIGIVLALGRQSSTCSSSTRLA
jgi:hypothetical protein